MTKPLPRAARDPEDRPDEVFQAAVFALLVLDLGIRFAADVWHLVR